MKLRTLLLCLLISFTLPVSAEETTNTIGIRVEGMVCDFCAQSVLKVLKKNESVQDVDINLDEGLVTVILKEGATIDDKALEEAIYYAGYELVEIMRNNDKEQPLP